MLESKTVGALCSKMSAIFTMAHLGRFSRFTDSAQYDAALASMWERTPRAGARPRSAIPPIVPSAMQDMIDAVDPGPDIGESTTVNLQNFGFDDDGDLEMAPPSQPTAPKPATPKQEPTKQEVKEEPGVPGTLGTLAGVRHPPRHR